MIIRTTLALLLLVAAPLATAATSLQVVLPANARTGVAFSFTVTARTGSAVDTAYLGTVHFTSSDGAATLPADYTFTLGDAGTHTFSATMATSGTVDEAVNQTITATDTVTPSITGTHATSVKWATDVVRRFRVQTPGTVDRTAPFNITVTAQNVDFQTVPTYLGTIHLEGSPGMSFPPDYTFTGSDNGVHTFSVSSSRGGDNAASARDVTNHLIAGTEWFYVVCPELTATAGNSGPVCAGTSVFLYGSSNQSGVDYHWQGPHFWTASAQNPTAPWIGTYTLTVSGANGCEAVATTTVEAISVPSMIVSGSATHACDGDVVTLTVDNASAFSDFAWSWPGGAPLPGNTATVQVPVQSATVISVRAKHVATGCNAGPGEFRIDNGPRVPVVLTAPQSACANATVSVSATTDLSEASIVWSAANATITNNQGWSIELMPDGSQPVTVTAVVENEYGTCPTVANAVITMDGTAPEILTQPQSASIPRGSTASLSVQTNSADLTFQWYRGASGNRSDPVANGRQSTLRTPPLEGTTSYWVEVSSDCGSVASATAVVSVPTKRRTSRH